VVLAPIALSIGMVRYQMLDVNVVIRRSLVYSLLSIVVVLIYLGVVSLLDGLATMWFGHTVFWMRMIVVFSIAVVFEPVRKVAQDLVDKVFFRTRHDQRVAFIEYSRKLANNLELVRLAKILFQLTDRLLPVHMRKVFVVEENSIVEILTGQGQDDLLRIPIERVPDLYRLVESRTTERLSWAKELGQAELLVPLRVEDRLVGLIVLGAKRSGETFDAEDIHFLKAIAAQTAVAFDRARAFKVIQDMNTSLEQMVVDRTYQLGLANSELAQRNQQLHKLNEMKEALTRMVVHDLKNPVSTILLGLEFVERSEVEQLPANVRTTLDIISATALEIQDLVSNLLDVYRMEAGELQLTCRPISLKELFEEGRRRVMILADYRRVKLDIQIQCDDQPILDYDLIIRVLVNLLTNAVKHSNKDDSVSLVAARTNSGFEITVANSGYIIPQEYHTRIFEKFFQVDTGRKKVVAGTGLGLAFCKLVVEAHGGEINVESPRPHQDDGAVFVVSLPGTDSCAGRFIP
jgi:signal transduction histidine kinase